MELTTAQRTAIDRLTDFAMGRTPHGIATLSGYAGVGKTTVVAQLLDEVSTALRVLVTAPTHKALAVLGSKLDDTQCELMTTHAALGMKLTELESGEHRLQREGSVGIADYDLAVVDEASMIHPDLFATMLSARRRCRILFVGDPAQLAPVGSDEISQAFGEVVPLHVRLDEVVRQAAEHPSIRFSIALCEDVAAGRAPSLLKLASLMQAGAMNGTWPSRQAERLHCRPMRLTPSATGSIPASWPSRTGRASATTRRSTRPCTPAFMALQSASR